YSCSRRDQYELTAPGPFPPALRERLAGRGAITGGAALWMLDVPGAYQLTVAPLAGRALLVPRLSTEPPAQRSAAIEIAAAIDAALGRAGAEPALP
ncbi:MAG: hypothetical protein IT372_15940, partial [Polyangiaceae bacterium]|nr:hypothetical protein [Polyangiaceae bacterium]